MKKILGVIASFLITVFLITVIPKITVKKTFAEKTDDIPRITDQINVDDAVKILKEKGIINGYEDGELHAEYTLTRAEFAVILNRTFADVQTVEKKYDFSDITESHWAYNDIQKACSKGWINGFDDKTFRPDENITYEQVLTVICRVLGISPYNAEYPYDYVSTAIEYAISDGVNAVIGEVINRGDVAKVIVNCLNYINGQIAENGDSYAVNYNVSSSKQMARVPSSGGGGSAAVYMTESVCMDDASYSKADEKNIYFEVFNTEGYNLNEENIFKKVSTSPLSTFSIDTDTASYSNMRRFILNGQKIPKGSFRTEELINYFDYAPAETDGEKPFGVKYTVSKCPWNEQNNLAMITVSGEELKEAKPSNIVFLIDVSGSMYDYNKLPLVKQSLGMLLDKLDENDRISVVTYASGTEVLLDATPANEKEKIMSVINGLSAGGGTYGSSGINLAYEQAEKSRCDGNNRVILCTDGDFNVGISSEAGLEKLISEKRESGIFLSVLGFGMGNYKDNKMEILADKGNGNYAYIDNLKEAKKVLIDEMSKTIYTIAKDVKIQVEFNPETVSEYRLVGYENRLLNNEDFYNDKKDAGELGAGASVTVLYEIVPQTGNETHPLKYQSYVTSGSDELMTVKIRYKKPEAEESILTEYPIKSTLTKDTDADFMFAVAVAELGMILNDSEFKGTSSLDSVLYFAKESVGDDPYGIRCEFVQLVDLLRYKED